MRAVLDGLGSKRHMAGCRPPLPHRLKSARLLIAPDDGFPARVDTRLVEPYEVLDQSHLGSCTAHGTRAVARYTLLRAGIDWKPSRLVAYVLARVLGGALPEQDSGASVADAVEVHAGGLPDEELWPYDLTGNMWSLMPPENVLAQRHHKALLYFHCPDQRTVRASIAQWFPVVFGFSVPQAFMESGVATSGLLYYPSPGASFVGGHCVAAVAYDDTMALGSDVGAFLVLNSWSENWGLGGYFWMPYRFFADYCFDAWTMRAEDRR